MVDDVHIVVKGRRVGCAAMIPNPDYGQPPPGGQVYTPEQAERMAAALLTYAQSMRLAAGGSIGRPRRREFRAYARAALHMHQELLAMLEGEA